MASLLDILNFLPIPAPGTSASVAASGLLSEPGSTAYNEQEMAAYQASLPTERNLNNVLPKSLVDAAERVKAERQNVIDPYAAAVAPLDAKIQDLRRQLPQFRTIDSESKRAAIENQISEIQKQKENLRVQTIPRLQAERAARASGLPTQLVGPNMYATNINVPLDPETKAAQALRQGIGFGTDKAREQNQGLLSQQQQQDQGFFGNIGDYINEDFLGRVLAIMARPEAFTDPRGLGAGIARAGQAVFAQEKEQAAAAAKRQLEYDKMRVDLEKEAIKAGGDKKYTDTVYKTIQQTTAAKRGMEAINTYREILSSGAVGGIGGKFEKILDRAGAIFNLGSGTLADRATNLRNQLIIELEEAIGSNNLNKTELENSLKSLSDPDSWTKSNQNLNKELDVVFRKLQAIENVGANTLEYFNYEPEAFSRKRPLHIGTRPSNR